MPSKINWGIKRLETLETHGGCTKCSPGCTNCWALDNVWRMASKKSLAKKWGGLVKKDKNGKLQWTGEVRLFPEALESKKLRGEGKTIFLNSKTDTFHPKVDWGHIEKIMAMIEENPQHEFMILTKRPHNMAEYFNSLGKRFELSCCPNVHLGLTICNQKEMDEKGDIHLSIPAAHHWISFEPLLGPIDATRVGGDQFGWGRRDVLAGLHYTSATALEEGSEWHTEKINKVDQVIIGCESGTNRRPIARKHIKDLYEQCNAAGIPVMVKQMAKYPDGTGTVIHDLKWIKAELGV